MCMCIKNISVLLTETVTVISCDGFLLKLLPLSIKKNYYWLKKTQKLIGNHAIKKENANTLEQKWNILIKIHLKHKRFKAEI